MIIYNIYYFLLKYLTIKLIHDHDIKSPLLNKCSLQNNHNILNLAFAPKMNDQLVLYNKKL